MDVRHQGDVDGLADFVDCQSGPFIRNRKAHKINTGGTHGADLIDGGLDVPGLGIAHALDRNR